MEDRYQMQPGQESGPPKPDTEDVDALLQDVKSLLGEPDAVIAAQEAPEPASEADDAPQAGDEPLRAEDVRIDYERFYGPASSTSLPSPRRRASSPTARIS